MNFIVSRDEERAGGFTVETMNDSRAEFAADGGEFAVRAEFVEQGVDHGAGFHSRARMDDHARGLVDDDQIVIGIENIEGNGFGLRVHGCRRGNFDGDCIAGFNAMGALRRSAVYAGVAVVEQRLDARAAEIGEMRRQKTIEAPACVFGRDGEFGGAREIARDIDFAMGFIIGVVTCFPICFVIGFVESGTL